MSASWCGGGARAETGDASFVNPPRSRSDQCAGRTVERVKFDRKMEVLVSTRKWPRRARRPGSGSRHAQGFRPGNYRVRRKIVGKFIVDVSSRQPLSSLFASARLSERCIRLSQRKGRSFCQAAWAAVTERRRAGGEGRRVQTGNADPAVKNMRRCSCRCECEGSPQVRELGSSGSRRTGTRFICATPRSLFETGYVHLHNGIGSMARFPLHTVFFCPRSALWPNERHRGER